MLPPGMEEEDVKIEFIEEEKAHSGAYSGDHMQYKKKRISAMQGGGWIGGLSFLN